MSLDVLTISVLIALVVTVFGFAILCGMAAEEKGRSWMWASMGLFNIFGLIVVLLLDRTIASEVNRSIAIERGREAKVSPYGRRLSPRSRSEISRSLRSSTSGAGAMQGPVGAWLSKAVQPFDSVPSSADLQQEQSGSADPVEGRQRPSSPAEGFLASDTGANAKVS